MSSSSISADEKLLLEQVSLASHPKDDMYVRSQAEHYLNVGISATRCVNSAVEGMEPIRTVLDLPCGYGRVMRFLKMRFPDAAFTACELNPEAVEYCKSKFSAEGVVSNPNPALIPIAKKFDLIWCGSLVTHLDRAKIEELLRFFCDRLEPGGVFVFTTQGERTAQRIEQNIYDYGLSLPAREAVSSKITAADGFGYVDYNGSSSYGVTLISRKNMSAIASSVGSWHEALFIPNGWDDHQDVYAFSKRQTPVN